MKRSRLLRRELKRRRENRRRIIAPRQSFINSKYRRKCLELS